MCCIMLCWNADYFRENIITSTQNVDLMVVVGMYQYLTMLHTVPSQVNQQYVRNPAVSWNPARYHNKVIICFIYCSSTSIMMRPVSVENNDIRKTSKRFTHHLSVQQESCCIVKLESKTFVVCFFIHYIILLLFRFKLSWRTVFGCFVSHWKMQTLSKRHT
jgi:hypothetical protein